MTCSAINKNSEIDGLFSLYVNKSDVVLNTSLEFAKCLTINFKSNSRQISLFFKIINASGEGFLFWHNFQIVCIGRNNTILGICADNCENFRLFNFWNFNMINNFWLLCSELLSLNDIGLSFLILDFNIQSCRVCCFYFMDINHILDLFDSNLLNIFFYDWFYFVLFNFLGWKLHRSYSFRNSQNFGIWDRLNINYSYFISLWFVNNSNLSLLGWFLILE